MQRFLWLLCCILACVRPALAHVGSRDVFEEINTQGYKLYVTVRMPTAIPGVATVEVRSAGAAVQDIYVTPLPITGEASLHPPTADQMVQSKDDPNFYTGTLWMMATGSWQVRFHITGANGDSTAAVPVPAFATAVLAMPRGLSILLSFLALWLVTGMAGIVAAAVRESDLKPGIDPGRTRRRQAWVAGAFAFVAMSLCVWSEVSWWHMAAAGYTADLYHPLAVEPVLQGNVLDLKVSSFNAINKMRSRLNNDFLPDHGHLMHLYMIRWPEMDAVYHVHPELTGPGEFRMMLPAMPAGEYRLYGDVVHANGFAETLVTTIRIPGGMAGSAPGPDDAAAFPPAVGGMMRSECRLPDGYAMVWERPQSFTASTAYVFHFALLDAKGNAAGDVVPYMGMAGHAAFVKTDGTVFAHTHPEGSAAMAATMLANGGSGSDTSSDAMAGMPMDMSMPMGTEILPNTVEFPYGFPTPGKYRIFVQMKHGGVIETGTFDAVVN